jgi:hypothetical protein
MSTGIKPRQTAKRVITRRLGQPSIRNNQESGDRQFILSYVDLNGNMCQFPTTKDICKVVADTSGEGEVPNGLDLLQDHFFVLHFNEEDTVVGLDIVPSKKYSSNTVPLTLVGVDDVQIQYQLGGQVCRVLRRSTKISPEAVITAIKDIDKLLTSKKQLEVGMKAGSATIEDMLNGVITIKLPLRKSPDTAKSVAEQLSES